MEKITEEMRQKLRAPLPKEALSQHPTKTFLTSIKAIYVEERLNDVFGVGSWTTHVDFIEKVKSQVANKKEVFPIHGQRIRNEAGSESGRSRGKKENRQDKYGLLETLH